MFISLGKGSATWMLGYRDLVTGLKRLELDPTRPVIAHVALSSFSDMPGGADVLLGALFSVVNSLMMPTFTYSTMVTPQTGPEHNAICYGSAGAQNLFADFFTLDMPADPSMGIPAETLRKMPTAHRSNHPILSFSGIRVEEILSVQTVENPLAPIDRLVEENGTVLLMGVNHTCNTSIHLAEKLAGRRQFTRWALTHHGVVECPGFPGCSAGFEMAAAVLEGITRTITIGNAEIRSVPLQEMITCLVTLIRDDPNALLCQDIDCERCGETRLSQSGLIQEKQTGINQIN